MSTVLQLASLKQTNVEITQLILQRTNFHERVKILDLGAGKGSFSRSLAQALESRALNPRDHLMAADLSKDGFEALEVPFRQANFNQPLPFANGEFDLVVSIEVFEHIHNVYGLVDECFRILKPGGALIVSTPNVLHLFSRLKFFFQGFFELFDPPSIKPENASRLCGHIMPLSLPYYDYGLRRAGFEDIKFYSDKAKRKSTALYYFLLPWLRLSSFLLATRIARKDTNLATEASRALEATNSKISLTSRSLVFCATKPPLRSEHLEFKICNSEGDK